MFNIFLNLFSKLLKLNEISNFYAKGNGSIYQIEVDLLFSLRHGHKADKEHYNINSDILGKCFNVFIDDFFLILYIIQKKYFFKYLCANKITQSLSILVNRNV